jgi:hypothetical protein
MEHYKIESVNCPGLYHDMQFENDDQAFNYADSQHDGDVYVHIRKWVRGIWVDWNQVRGGWTDAHGECVDCDESYEQTYEEAERESHVGWPGDGSGEDDLADYNANEADDYANE